MPKYIRVLEKKQKNCFFQKYIYFKKVGFKMISVLWRFVWPVFGGPKILVYIYINGNSGFLIPSSGASRSRLRMAAHHSIVAACRYALLGERESAPRIVVDCIRKDCCGTKD